MKHLLSSVAIAATTLACGSPAWAAGTTAEVMHWWVSAGESAAIRQVADAYVKTGGVWKDNAIAGGEVAIPAIISRITGGDPPTAAQMPLGKQLEDLVDQGLLANVDDAAKATGFYENIPEVFQKAMKFPDGHLYAVPINDHGHNWVFFNEKVLADAGTKAPVTWTDLFAAADAIKTKGNAIPIAVGAQPWQLGQTFLSVLLTKEGPVLFNKVFGDLDTAAVKSDAFTDAFNTFIKLRNYSDDGATNREWNVAANMVITGKAGFQFMGDWAKGEFLAAGLKPGKEFGCEILGNGDGKRYFNVSSDAMIFPVSKKAGQAEAQQTIEKLIMGKEIQVAFNAKKGSEPARLDVDANQLDACASKGVEILRDPQQRVPNVDFLISPDAIGAERDLAAQAWADKSMDAAKFEDAFLKIIEAEKSSRK